MADPEAKSSDSEPNEAAFGLNVAQLNEALPQRDEAIQNALQRLGITARHDATLTSLREFKRAHEAVCVLYEEFGDDLDNFLTQPLADYGGKSVVDLVAEHGVRALEAVRSDVEYPVPA